MVLTDIQPLEKWVELEKKIYEKSRLMPAVYNTKGIRITDYKQWANRICPAIKSIPKGQTFICAVAHENMAAMAQKSRQPVVEECDAGMVKVVVPIFVNDEFVGAAGGCGLLTDDGEFDTFLVNKTTDMAEDEMAALTDDLGSLSMNAARELAEFVEGEIRRIVEAYKNRAS